MNINILAVLGLVRFCSQRPDQHWTIEVEPMFSIEVRPLRFPAGCYTKTLGTWRGPPLWSAHLNLRWLTPGLLLYYFTPRQGPHLLISSPYRLPVLVGAKTNLTTLLNLTTLCSIPASTREFVSSVISNGPFLRYYEILLYFSETFTEP